MNNRCCLAQFLPRSWQLREERETCSLQAAAVMLHMLTCKGGLNYLFILQSAASPKGNHPWLRMVWHNHGSQPQCSCWKESPKHPIPTGRRDRILSQDTSFLRNTTGNDNPAKESQPFTSLGRDLPSYQGGLIPKKIPKCPELKGPRALHCPTPSPELPNKWP